MSSFISTVYTRLHRLSHFRVKDQNGVASLGAEPAKRPKGLRRKRIKWSAGQSANMTLFGREKSPLGPYRGSQKSPFFPYSVERVPDMNFHFLFKSAENK